MQDTPRQSPLLGILKGAVIAIGALLPGISGGALCVIMGIYKPMMALLADPIHQFKKQIGFFWPIAVGMLVGTLGISKLLGDFLERSETAAIFLFIGLIVGTLPSLLREARQQGVARGSMAALAIALLVMLAWDDSHGPWGTGQRDPELRLVVPVRRTVGAGHHRTGHEPLQHLLFPGTGHTHVRPPSARWTWA